ncbi:MAG: gamma-glutamyltransferase family protein [Cloacibacillus sp.]
MKFNAEKYSYPSRRTLVYGARGMTATTQPLAAQAGLEMLRRGGNAVDAAVAAAACLTVVEPTSNGIGGDAFALVWMKGELHGLNSSGFAPALADASALSARGLNKMPLYGWEAVTVPGAPGAWAELNARFGRLPLQEVLAPAVYYAENGFPVSPTVSLLWKKAFAEFKKNLKGAEFAPLFDSFTKEGRAPEPGELWRSPQQGQTLRKIAESGARSFYAGELAAAIDAYSRQYGGWLRAEDLAAFAPEWVKPICADYRGYKVWEIPPNGQGIVALMALNILKNFELTGRECARSYHLQIEAIKLAFAEAVAEVGDPRRMKKSVEAMISDELAARSAAMLDERRAGLPTSERQSSGGTVYLAAADDEGNMVSMIQSNYHGFGSGLCVPGTGITLHNRGNNFSLDPASPNFLTPGVKPYHTIIPGFITKNERAVGPFGVMGAFMQPQGHLQMIVNMVDFALNPQESLDAPRWQWLDGRRVGLEQGVDNHIARELSAMGHDIRVDHDCTSYGRGQMILRDEGGSLVGATEPRADGCVAVY